MSRAVGWGIAPPTIMRGGPSGPGMCQLWIDADATTDLIALSRRSDHPQLRDMAVFDAVVSNADGKIRHRCRCPTGGCSAAITVCLGEEYKLWIVLWQWRGRRLPGRALQALAWAARGAGLGRSGGRTSRAAVPGQGTGRATALDC